MARITGDLEAVRHFTAWAIYIIFENVTILLFAIGLRMAGWLINDVQRFIASAEKVEELLNEEPKITNAVNKKNVENFKGIVDFKQVSFSYGEESVLKDITFKIMPGQTIGIIGPTGA